MSSCGFLLTFKFETEDGDAGSIISKYTFRSNLLQILFYADPQLIPNVFFENTIYSLLPKEKVIITQRFSYDIQ